MKRDHCVFCGRLTLKPVAFIGEMPVGPTCARRHNMGIAIRGNRGAIRSAEGRRNSVAVQRDSLTRDLFEAVPS